MRVVPLLLIVLYCGFGIAAESPTRLQWSPHPVNILPSADASFQYGPKSGNWVSDLQYFDGLWIVGDGFGGIWYSSDAMHWKRGQFAQDGKPRRMQNAPVRSIEVGSNGTLLATFLGGGGLASPEAAKLMGLTNKQRAPVARSTDGIHWEVARLPSSCGPHTSATDGKGTWIIPGCKTSILISTNDGRSWQERDTGLGRRTGAMGHIRGVWILGAGGGAKGGIFYSRDLVEWRLAMPFPYIVSPKRTLHLNDSLVMTGTWSFLATSSDGIDWVVRSLKPKPSPSFIMQAGIWHPRLGYVLAGKRGVVMQSVDLVNWEARKLPWKASTIGMAVSPDGVIYASGPNPDGSFMRRAVAR